MSALALDLDHDGIRLLQRQDGEWTELDRVALDAGDLPDRMRALCALARDHSDGALETVLIIPPSQILYTVLADPPADRTQTDAFVAEALTQLTPCPIDELVFDWRRVPAGIAVAALEINTLDEAEGFATTYDFNPVGFSARPAREVFPDMPDFGPTEAARHAAATSASPVFASARPASLDAPEAPVAQEAAPDAEQTANIFAEDFEDEDAPQPLTVEAPMPEPAPVAPVAPPTPVTVRAAAPASPAPAQPMPARPAQQAGRRKPAAPPRRWPLLGAVAGGGAVALGALLWIAVTVIAPGSGVPIAYTPDAPEDATGLAELAQVAVLPGPAEDSMATRSTYADPEMATATPAQMRGRAALVLPGPHNLADAREMADPSALVSASFWQTPPPPPPDPVGETLDDLYLASIDPLIQMDDAFALFTALPDHDTPQAPPSPPDAALVFDLDERGLVVATPEGALTPDGVIVTLGRPARTPPDRPVTAVAVADPEIALALAGKKARARPSDLIQRMERAQLGGRTVEEMATIRARARPESAQEAAIAEADTASPSALAVEVSRAPSSRPTDFAAIVEAVRRQQAVEPQGTTPAAAVAALVPVQPSIPSSASVARQATIENAINLKRLNLIGVYGSDGNRRALIRLPSGRYQKVEIGDRIDGGRIDAISDNELRYVKGGRNVVLRVPSS